MFGLFKKKSLAKESFQKKSGYQSSGTSGFMNYVLNGCGKSGLSASESMQIYRDSSTVNSAVRRIADVAKTIDPVLIGPDGKIVSEHPILDLFYNPNPFDTKENFFDDAITHYLVTGDSDFFALGNIKYQAQELYSVKPVDVSYTETINSRYAKQYKVTSGEGKGNYDLSISKGPARYLDGTLKEFVRVRSFSSKSTNAESDSPLEAAALEARQQIQARIHNLSLLGNGARPSSVFAFNEPLDEDQARERLQSLNEQLTGPRNAGRIAVTGAHSDGSKMLEIHELGQSNRDMDWSNLDQIAATAIYVTYKIPLPMVSNDASTFNNMENAVYHLYDQAVIPCWLAVVSGLARVLLPRFGLDPKEWSLTYDPETIPALRSRTMEELKTRQSLGIETINELRSQLPGREPLEGGDILYQAANLVPVGTDLYTEDNTSSEEEAARIAQEVANE